MKKSLLIGATLLAVSSMASAITIVNNNTKPIDYTIYTNGFATTCASATNFPVGAQITWTSSSLNPLCQHPEHVEVHVSGASSTKGAFCTSHASSSPQLLNDGTVATVSDAGFLQGVHCYTD